MKKIILVLIVGILSGCMTIKTPDMTPVAQASYQEIIDIPGKSQLQIFELSKQWIALNFVSAKNVIEYENAADGKIIGNGSTTVYFHTEGAMTGTMSYPQPIPFIMVEDVKDGKARISFDAGESGKPAYAWEQLKPKFISLSENLKSYLVSPDKFKNW